MATALFTTGNENTVGALFKCPHEKVNLQPAGARCTNNPDIHRILKAHGTCQVRSRIGAIMAAEGNNFGFEFI